MATRKRAAKKKTGDVTPVDAANVGGSTDPEQMRKDIEQLGVLVRNHHEILAHNHKVGLIHLPE